MKTVKKFGKSLLKAFAVTLICLVICSFVYPLTLTGISQLTMKNQANGSLIDENGEPTNNPEQAVGSVVVGQAFTEPCYFRGRESAVNYNTYTQEDKDSGKYTGVASGSYNYGNSHPELKARIEEDLETFLKEHPDLSAENIPSDLLTASGSGLDPHISLEAATIQIPSIAKHSGLTETELYQIVDRYTEHKVLGIFGQEKVNVLKCNLEICKMMKAKA